MWDAFNLNAIGISLETRKILFTIQVPFQRYRDANSDIYVCFIDYQKALDRVKHDNLISILKNTGLDDKYLRIIINLYYNHLADIRVENEMTEEVYGKDV